MTSLKVLTAILLISASATNSIAAQTEPLGAIWREGEKDNTIFIVGTLRSVADLDQLAAVEGKPDAATKPQLHDPFLRFEAQCSESDFSVHIKASAFGREPPLLNNVSPYSFEDSPLQDASVVVNGQSSLNLHYLWGSVNGASTHPDDRLNLTGSVYRFLRQIGERSTSEIRIYIPSGSSTYVLDKSYQEAANSEAIAAFKQQCGKIASEWH